jgi:regulator of protease activity HflC (stomatin/prohibitin superfamily)
MSSFATVQQASTAVVTMFGKYRRVMKPGLNIRIPLIEPPQDKTRLFELVPLGVSRMYLISSVSW